MRAGQTGVITTRPGRAGRLVQFVTGYEPYHTIYAVSEEVVVSAQIPKVMFRNVSDYPDAVWTNEEVTPEGLELAKRFLSQQIGKPYAYWDIFLLGVASVLRTHTPKRLVKKVRSTRRWYCSSLCYKAMVISGVNPFPDHASGAVTPNDFYELITSLSGMM